MAITYEITDAGSKEINNPRSAFYANTSPEALEVLDEVLKKFFASKIPASCHM